MRPPVKTRKVVFRKDTFLQKITSLNSALLVHASETINDIKVLNDSVVLEVAPKEKK